MECGKIFGIVEIENTEEVKKYLQIEICGGSHSHYIVALSSYFLGATKSFVAEKKHSQISFLDRSLWWPCHKWL